MSIEISLAALVRRASALLVATLALAVLAIVAAPSAEAARHRKHSNGHSHSVAEHNRAGYVGRSVSSSRHAKANRHRNVRVASLGNEGHARSRPSRSVASSGGGNIIWQASSGCLNGALRSIVHQVSTMATVRVSSTCRSHGHNARVGGAKRSQHLTGDAVDFRVLGGNSGAVYAYLRSNSSVGGLKHYGGGLFHVDTGPRRSW